MNDTQKVKDEFYPTIGIKSTAKIKENDQGYQWEITTHVEGPDELMTQESDLFFRKDKCTEDLWANYPVVVSQQLLELGQ